MPKDPLKHLYSREALDAQPSAIRDICALVARPEVCSLAGGCRIMHLAAQVFIDREDMVIVGLPTYFGGPGAVYSRSGRVVGISVDRDGLNPNRLRQEIKRLQAAGKRVKGI